MELILFSHPALLQVSLDIAPMKKQMKDDNHHEEHGGPFMDLDGKMSHGCQDPSPSPGPSRQDKPVYETGKTQKNEKNKGDHIHDPQCRWFSASHLFSPGSEYHPKTQQDEEQSRPHFDDIGRDQTIHQGSEKNRQQ